MPNLRSIDGTLPAKAPRRARALDPAIDAFARLLADIAAADPQKWLTTRPRDDVDFTPRANGQSAVPA